MKNYLVDNYTLDDYQMHLLLNDENTIVIAGAGAGKTLTIIGKINYLLETQNLQPENILIISFTNASVKDIKNRIKSNAIVLTFHKLAMYILEKVNYDYTISNSKTLNFIIEETVKTASEKEQKIILKFLKLKTKFNSFLYTHEYKSFCRLIETFINLWKTNDFKYNNLDLSKFSKIEKNILIFIFNIYKKYNLEKTSTNQLDFDDLILYATNLVSKANLKFKYIIIDEFQDTSFIRLNLIKNIVQNTNSNIIVVGDDWQSIYRFSGCDLKLFLNFPSFFSNVQIIKLVNTYRNSQELIQIAATFVQKNPLQISKNLKSFKNNQTPLIFAPYKNQTLTLKKILDHLLTISNDIMILSRNNNDIHQILDKDISISDNLINYKNHQIKFYTVHKSKGLEAEYVIIINCNNHKLGFPNKIENNPIINKLSKSFEIKFAEERRLFYVAITRCKQTTYLLYDEVNPSIFIKEIKKITKKQLGTISYF